jgi:hypothetical protein
MVPEWTAGTKPAKAMKVPDHLGLFDLQAILSLNDP